MSTYRLFPTTNGPSATAATSSNFLAGIGFAVAGGGKWFTAYWYWVASDASTAPVPCALWSATSSGGGVVVPGSSVTSGTLTAGAWNRIPLSTPIQLAASWDPAVSTHGSVYVAAIGVNGKFSDTQSMFNSGDTYSAGIANGPLHAYSGTTGSNPAPYGLGQGLFSVASNDPTLAMPNQADGGGDGGSNFWVDVEISDTAPAGYAGTWRTLPNKYDANNVVAGDAAVAYVVGGQRNLSTAFQCAYMHYFVPAGTTASAGLATEVGVWDIPTQTLKAHITSPVWTKEDGGSVTFPVPGPGTWVKAPFPANSNIPADNYRIGVYNANGANGSWAVKDATSGYWSTGVGASGIVTGPVTAPNQASADLADFYPGTGTGQTGGQPTFAYSGLFEFPHFTTGLNPPQEYFVDLEGYQTSRSGTGSANISLAATSSGSSAHHGTGAAAVALGAIDTATSVHNGSGSSVLNLGASSAGSSVHSGTGSAKLELAVTVPPKPKQTGPMGWDLFSTLALQVEYKRYYDAQIPIACPHCGTPLKQGPSAEPQILFCPHGDFYYPEDWDPGTMSGM